jgi:hypothetical protein
MANMSAFQANDESSILSARTIELILKDFGYRSLFAILLVMKNNKPVAKTRNWFLVFIASILLVLGFALLIAAVIHVATFGWWSLLIGLSGLTTIVAAAMSIIKNDPSWILLDLIIPG